MLDLSKLFTLSRDLGFITDLRGAILEATAGSEQALGYRRDELVGLDLPHLDEAGDLRRFFDAQPPRSRLNLTFPLRTRSGQSVAVEATATLLRDETGKPVGWFIAGQDLKGAVAEARDTKPILDALVDSIGAALWSFDRNGTVLTWGGACERAFSIPRAEAEGKLPVVRLLGSPEEYRRVVRTVEETGQFSGELPLVGGDGAVRLHQVSVTPLVTGDRSTGYVGVSFDVSERKRAEEFRRNLFEQAGEAILVLDASTLRVLEANAKAWELHGYAREEFLGLRTEEVVDPAGLPSVPEVLKILAETGRYEGDHHFHRRKDGSRFPCSINLRLVSVGDRRFIIAVVRDLTAQRNAEEFHRVLFEQAGEAIVVVDHASRRILDANEKAAELHGYTRAEFLRLRVEDYVAPIAQHEVQEISRALDERGYYEGRQFHRRKDGSLFPCSLNLKAVKGGDRRMVVSVHRDLTQELKADEFFRVLFEKASDAVYLVKDEGLEVAEANEAACRLLGYSREEFLRLKVVDLVPPPYRHRIPEFHESVKRGIGYRRDRRMLLRKDGSMVATDQAVSRVEIGDRPYYIASCRDLTEQERISRELEEAKSFLEHVQETANDGIAILNEQGVYVAVNRKLLEMHERTREELVGHSYGDLARPEQKAAYDDYFRRLLAGEAIRMQTRLRGASGRELTVDVSSSSLERGGRKYVVALIRDVTQEVQAEEDLRKAHEQLEQRVADRTAELRESEERFRGAFERGGIGMALVGLDGRFLKVNRTLAEMLGYGEQELLERTFVELTHPDDREKSLDAVWKMVQEGMPAARMEKRYLHRSGRPVWADLATSLIHADDGSPMYFVTTIQDVTERKRAEEDLRESERRFRAITETIPVPVTITRPGGEILYVNEAAVRLFGLRPADAIGQDAGSFYANPDERPALRERLLRESSVTGYELQLRRPEGSTFWAVVSLRLMTFQGGTAILGSFLDIDDRKRTEELLRKSREDLEQRVQERTAELAQANARLRNEVAERKRAEHALRVILEGTAAVTGGTFFRSLVRHLASALEVRYALVVQGLGRPPKRARTIAFWAGDDFGRSMEYDLQDTPCEDVLAGQTCCYSHDVQRLFPEFRILGDLGVDSYLGVPISDSSGAVVGQLVVMDSRPVLEEELKLSVLKIFAARAGAELERQLAEEALKESEERWRSLVVNAPDFILTVDRAGKVVSINRTTPGMRPEDVVGTHVLEFIPEDSKAVVQNALDSVFLHGKPASYETRAPGPNGGFAWYASRVGPIVLRGEVVGATFIATEITERRKADQALRESEERWRSLVANAPDSITTVNREGRILSINRVVAGFRMEDVVGKLVYEFVPPESMEKVRGALERVFSEGTSESFETPSPGPHGSKAWYSSRVGPVILDGRVEAATIISTDITERWKAEQRQKIQHEVTRVLTEAASLEEAVPRLLRQVGEGLDWPLGILWKADPAANVLRLADAWVDPKSAVRDFLESTGKMTFPPGVGLPGRVWGERATHWISDVQKDTNFPRIQAAARMGIHAAFAAPVEGPRGIFGVVEFLSTEIRLRDEPLLQVVTTLGSQLGQFIERKRAEADVRFQKTLLESQSEAAIDGILVVSREGVMLSYNRRFVQMWEIPPDVLDSRTDERALQSVLDKLEDPREFLGRVRHLYEHPDEESRDEVHLKDGRTFDRYSAPVKGKDGVLYGRVWYFRDVTGRKQTEENLRRAAEETRRAYEELKEAQSQLIRSEKLASIGMLVSGVAHEINNPLNVMYGNLQLLSEVSDVLLPLSVEGAKARKVRGIAARVSKFRGMIRDALKAARHTRGIVQDFRNFARDTRTAELVDLNECLEEAVTLIQREIKPGIRLVRKLGRIPPIRCLRGQMSQVFLNLLKNAEEAIEKRGTVTLRTLRADGHVVVEVADTGRGMPDEIRRKLFEPFFTTKPVGQGLGLGLSISAMIVQNHNGRIEVRTKPGRGSIFRVELPLRS